MLRLKEIFENVKNNEVLHEFSFFDEKNGVSGTIDCLIKKKDEIEDKYDASGIHG